MEDVSVLKIYIKKFSIFFGILFFILSLTLSIIFFSNIEDFSLSSKILAIVLMGISGMAGGMIVGAFIAVLYYRLLIKK